MFIWFNFQFYQNVSALFLQGTYLEVVSGLHCFIFLARLNMKEQVIIINCCYINFIIILISSKKNNNNKTNRLEQVFSGGEGVVFSLTSVDCLRRKTTLLYTECWWKVYTEVKVTIPWVPETFLARFQCGPSANTENFRRTREHYLWYPGYSNEVLASSYI